MSELWVQNLSISLDGYGAGPGQDLDHPLGMGGERLHEWLFPPAGSRSPVDERFFTAGQEGVGATIMGRNMFGPVRGPWEGNGPGSADWTGWWGEDPPFHHDVFVLTHHARPPVPMAGGTTFHFVTDGIEAALQRARAAARGAPVRLGGGVSTVRQYLRAGLLRTARRRPGPPRRRGAALRRSRRRPRRLADGRVRAVPGGGAHPPAPRRVSAFDTMEA